MGDEMKKDTVQILKELENCDSFKAFYKENKEYIVKKELSAYLSELVEKKGIKKADVIRRSGLNESYAYQIFTGIRVPERRKLLCLAVAMELNLDEIQTLLKTSGYAQLYVKNEFDCIVIYGIINNLTVIEINSLLYDNGFETLG